MAYCLVIGAGPAGLTAAIYLARFHLSAVVIEDARSRLALIPLICNHRPDQQRHGAGGNRRHGDAQRHLPGATPQARLAT